MTLVFLADLQAKSTQLSQVTYATTCTVPLPTWYAKKDHVMRPG